MKYYVTIQATVRKTYEVEAEDKLEAQGTATEIFSVLEDGTPEYYNQEVIDIESGE